MKRSTVLAAVAAAAFVVVALVLLVTAGGRGSGSAPAATGASGSDLLGSDPRILGERGSSDVPFMEFLDFKCEACGAAYPVVEQVREEYGDRVTFALRYFPIPSHVNAEPTARAVESAARQGKLVEMYSLMYDTQREWGEKREPQDLFRSYAESFGLDMAQYDADVTSDEVAARVQRDVQAGTELGVRGTPTFFVDGELFEPVSVEDLSTALDDALAGSSPS